MGKRGPGASRLREAAARAPATVRHPWEKRGMPAADRVLAFLRTLPIVAGLKAGQKMKLLDFQEQFVPALIIVSTSAKKRWISACAFF
jgi:hypothetical protein